MLGNCGEMRLNRRHRKSRVNGRAVIQDVQVRFLKIDDALSRCIFYKSILDVPLLGNGPIEYLRPRRDFVNLQGNPLLNERQGLPESVAGYAPADWKKFGRKLMQSLANFAGVLRIQR